MREQYGPFGLSYEEEAARLHNLELCERYIAVSGPARCLDRAEYSTDIGSMVMPVSLGNDPRDLDANRYGYSFKAQAESYEATGDPGTSFPEWRLYNAKYYTTEDPGTMFIECDGEGMRIDHAKRYPDIGYYKNNYILTMVFEDGLLDQVWEWLNPSQVYYNFPWWHREPEMY